MKMNWMHDNIDISADAATCVVHYRVVRYSSVIQHPLILPRHLSHTQRMGTKPAKFIHRLWKRLEFFYLQMNGAYLGGVR